MSIRIGSMLLIITMILVGMNQACKSSSQSSDRWTQTDNTSVNLDWDAVMEAYKKADGPSDFEQKVNEIYTGPEIISVFVRDIDAKNQQVSGFFDENLNGAMEDNEKIFTINREIGNDYNSANYRVDGYGHYHGYHSSGMWNLAAGMVVGAMISRAMMPSYVPMYTTPYTTSRTKVNSLKSYRSNYRTNNPNYRGTTSRPSATGSNAKTGQSGSTWGNRDSGFNRSGSSSSGSSSSGSSSSGRRSGSSSFSGGSGSGSRQRRNHGIRLTE